MTPASYEFTRGGWASEAFETIASLGVIAIAVCGLAGMYAPILAAAGTIVFGVALTANGARLLHIYNRTSARDEWAWSGPLRFSVLAAGAIGAALAIFALFGSDPAFLTPIASVLFGAGLVLRSNVVWELSFREFVRSAGGASRMEQAQAVGNDAAVFALSGFVSGALGAIAAAGGPNDLTLNLVSLLIASSTLVLWSRVAMAVTARLLQPMSFVRQRAAAGRRL